MCQYLGDSLQILLVDDIEGVEFITVDIENCFHLIITDDWYDDFRARQGTACDVSGELLYVRHDDCCLSFVGSSAYTFTVWNAVAGNASLKRSETKSTVAL